MTNEPEAIQPVLVKVNEVAILTNAIRSHQNQISELTKRRKGVILSLRNQNITYKEISMTAGVSKQLIYKIIRDEIDRTMVIGADGKPRRKRGRPPKMTTEGDFDLTVE